MPNENQDIINAFDSSVKTYTNDGKKNLTSCNKRVFNFVKAILEENKDYVYIESDKTILFNDILKSNIKSIEANLLNQKANSFYDELIKKFDELKGNINQYKQMKDYIEKHNIISNELQDDFKAYELKVIYGLLELQVSLDLDTSDITVYDKNLYSEIIAHDIINNNYKPLDIVSHIDKECGNISFNKVKKI